MNRDIFEVRGNINPTMERMERLRIEREEREKTEREARYERERKEREERSAAWKKEHWILDKYTFISEYNYNSYCFQGDKCDIKFYEWSDINREPLKFPNIIPFFRFLDSSKIFITDGDVNKFKTHIGCHIVCKPNSNHVIVGDNYEDMKNKFLTEKALMSVPDNMTSNGNNNLPAVVTNDNKVKVLQCGFYQEKSPMYA